MSSAAGETSYEIKCEIIQKINDLCEYFEIRYPKEISTNMSIMELNNILKEVREFIRPKQI